MVNIRPRSDFAAGHIPGALGIELDDSAGVWVGWLLPFNSEVGLIANRDQDIAEMVTQLGRIGFDRVRGVLYDTDGWEDGDGQLAFYRTVDVDG